jgi:GDP-D-mannose dehydratase
LAFEFLDLDYKNFIHIQAGSSRRTESVQLVADTAHALKKLDWRTTVSFEEMIREMTEFDFRIQSTGLAH